MGFPTKNDHFGVFWGYHYLKKHPYNVTRFLLLPHHFPTMSSFVISWDHHHHHRHRHRHPHHHHPRYRRHHHHCRNHHHHHHHHHHDHHHHHHHHHHHLWVTTIVVDSFCKQKSFLLIIIPTIWWLQLGHGPFPVTVTTRLITFLVENPFKPLFATGILGRGHTQTAALSFPPQKKPPQKFVSYHGNLRYPPQCHPPQEISP